MQWTDRIRQVKVILVVAAALICAASLVWSHRLVTKLSQEERGKMEVWAEAMRSFSNDDGTGDISLELAVMAGNNTIPVIVLGPDGSVYDFRNIELRAESAADTTAQLKALAAQMKDDGHVIPVRLDLPSDIEADGTTTSEVLEVCYDESTLIKRLAKYPYIQLGVVLIFVVVAIFALLSSKRAEQNKVWVGLSKETAHQLGTPISSLLAWTQMLRETYPDDELLPELDKDVQRLQVIAERFSKIGSLPEPQPENLNEVVNRVVEYIGRRTSNRVSITCRMPQQPLYANLCAPLFEWVVENLCKNAIDAMDGQGAITIGAWEETSRFVVEVSDTGKGIPQKHFKSVFSPGFTTKKRGWGLGLSLAKRIVEEYHRGRIFVKSSEVGKGTTFRIELRKK